MPQKSSAAHPLLRFSLSRVSLCASVLAAVAALSGCGGSSDTPETPVLPRAWSPVSVSAVSSLSVPEVFSDGVGGALVVTSSPTNTLVQRFDAVAGWQLAQIFPLATTALRSASGVTLVGHDASTWWRIDVTATTASALIPVLPYALTPSGPVIVSAAQNGRLLFTESVFTESSGRKVVVREVEGAALVATTLFDDATGGILTAFVRDADGDWMTWWLAGRRENYTGLAMRGPTETSYVTKLSGATGPFGDRTSLGPVRMEGDGHASLLGALTPAVASPTVGIWYRMISGSLQDIWTLGDVKPGRPDQTSRVVRADGTHVWAAFDSASASNRIWEGRTASTWVTTDATEAACPPSRMNCQAFAAPSGTRVASLSQNAGQPATSNDLFISERAQIAGWASSARVSLATLASAGGDASSTSHQLAAYVESGPAQIVVGFVRYQLSPSDTRYATFATGK